MSQIQSIFKNMSWLLIAQIVTSICGFIWTLLMGRYLGVSDFGIINFAFSFTGILEITMDLGISTYIVRHISTDYDSAPKYLGNAIPLKMILSSATFLLGLSLLVLNKYNLTTVYVTSLFIFERSIISMWSLFNGSFQAFEKGKFQAYANIIGNVLTLIFILICVFCDLGLYSIPIAYILAEFIALIYIYISFRNNITSPIFEFDKNFNKKLILTSIPFALTNFFTVIYYSIDMVMIKSIVGSYANGIYSASYKLVSMFMLFYTIYSAVIFPVMNKFFKNEEEILPIILEKSIKYLMLVMIPFAFATMFYSSDIITLFFGKQFIESSSVLSILIWTVCLLFINGVCTNLLNASHKEKYVTKIYMVAALFNVCVNLYLIPKYSYNGAAVATVLSDILITILFFYMIRKIGKLPNIKLIFDLIKIIFASLILYSILYVLNISMWFAIPLGILVYLIIIICLKTFDSDDKYIIKEILNRN